MSFYKNLLFSIEQEDENEYEKLINSGTTEDGSIQLLNLNKVATKPKMETPLHYAAKYGSVKVAEYLVTECKAKKELRDYKNRTALYIAAEYGIKLLLESYNFLF